LDGQKIILNQDISGEMI